MLYRSPFGYGIYAVINTQQQKIRILEMIKNPIQFFLEKHIVSTSNNNNNIREE